MAAQRRYLFGQSGAPFEAYLTYDDVTSTASNITVANNDTKSYKPYWIWNGVRTAQTIAPGAHPAPFAVPAGSVSVQPDGSIRTPPQLTEWGLE